MNSILLGFRTKYFSCFIVFKGAVGGSSADFVHKVIGIPLSFGVELRDSGEFGTLLPQDEIIQNGEESLAAILKLADVISANELYAEYLSRGN